MRSSIALGLALVWLFGLLGCGGDDSSEVASNDVDAAPAGGPGMAGPGPVMGGPEMEGDGSSGGGPGMEGGSGESGPGMGAGMEGDMSSEGEPGMGMEDDMSGDGMEGDESSMYEGMEGDMSGDGMEGDESSMYEGMEGDMSGQSGPGMGPGPNGGYQPGVNPGMEGMEGDMEGMEDGMSNEGGSGMYSGAGGPGSGGAPGMYGTGAPGRGQAAKPKTFADMAQMAFQQGDDQKAFQYLFAHAVTADDAAARELLGTMGWITPQKQPALAVRWGIGIEFNARGYEGNNIYPIGTNQKMPERGGRGGAGGTEGGGMEFGGPGAGMQGQGGGQINAQLQKYTGELGQRLVEGLQERASKGDFGEVLKTAGAGGAQRSGAGGMNYGGPGMGMEMGGYGEESDGGGGMEGGYGAGRPRRNADAEDSVTQLSPGVVLLGPAPSKELLEAAKKVDLNALCVFSVSVAVVRRTQQISTTYKVQVYNVADGKETYEYKERLNNIAVQVARANENTRGGDPIDEAMEKLFEHIDGEWRLSRMPALQQEHALNRIGALLSETHENPLGVLAEIRMFHTRGLIEDNHLLLAYKRKLGNDQFGTELATGTEEEKKQVIAEWVR